MTNKKFAPEVVDTLKEKMKSHNLFINGRAGSGKSALLHELLEVLSSTPEKENDSVYIHDPKGTEFNVMTCPFSAYSFTNSDKLISLLSSELKERETLSPDQLNEKKRIVVLSDEFADDEAFSEFVIRHYENSLHYRVAFVLVSQLRDCYYRYQRILDSGVVITINEEHQLIYEKE